MESEEETSLIWLKPSEESFYIANHWKGNDYEDVLDFGCGLGRHSIFFAEQGFNVSAFDLSQKNINHLKKWTKDERLTIDLTVQEHGM